MLRGASCVNTQTPLLLLFHSKQCASDGVEGNLDILLLDKEGTGESFCATELCQGKRPGGQHFRVGIDLHLGLHGKVINEPVLQSTSLALFARGDLTHTRVSRNAAT